jgi:hypothetical protein
VNRSRLPLVRRCSLFASSLFLASVALTAPAFAQTTSEASASAATAAQESTDPNPGAISTSGGLDLQSTYMFRGIRQNSTGLATWPWFDVGIAAYAGDGTVKTLSINVGSWNSQHTGDTGADGPSQKFWYESDFYTTLGLGFGGGVSLATTYTAYTSPNNTFTTVKELMFKLAIDDGARLGRAALKPYAIVARELAADPGIGQVPLGATSKYGSWNIHGGAEYQRLGTNTASFNGGDRHRVIGSIGMGFAY